MGVVHSPLKTRWEHGLVSRFLCTFWPGGFGGSYFYRPYYLIQVKHHKVKISKDTDYATLNYPFLKNHGAIEQKNEVTGGF